ncbi:hypothetical protein D3C84_1219780 [compost metagenome]
MPFSATAASCIAVSAVPTVTGVVITTASTECPCCIALSRASCQSPPTASIGAARQAQRSPPFRRAAAIWVFSSLASAPRAVSRSD